MGAYGLTWFAELLKKGGKKRNQNKEFKPRTSLWWLIFISM